MSRFEEMASATGYPWARKDAPVCITGYGASSGFHKHTRIERFTSTMIIVTAGLRFRYSDGSLASVPYSTTDGKYIAQASLCPHKAMR